MSPEADFAVPRPLEEGEPVPPFALAFEGLVTQAGASTPPETTRALHRAFEMRTGAFGPDDPWFESRSRAFWDDAMTRQRSLLGPLPPLPSGARLWWEALARFQRGLFRSRDEGGIVVLVDALSGAEFVLHEVDPASRDALASTSGLFDGTVVALQRSARVVLLPGTVFHLEGAEDAIAGVVAAARTRGLADSALLDALLRMELSLRTMSRVKPAYAYRPEALAG